jgi:hypothetical protein
MRPITSVTNRSQDNGASATDPSRRNWLKTLATTGLAVSAGYSSFAISATDAAPKRARTVDRLGRPAIFSANDRVKVSVRYPIGHYRTPIYLRGKSGVIVRVVEQYINPEEEGYGKDAGDVIWLYEVKFSQTELWPDYSGKASDHLQLEIYENWLEKA